MFRAEPAMPVQSYKTYALRDRPVPRARRASCAEVACPNHIHGWRTTLDPHAHAAQIAHIRNDTRRKHIETRSDTGQVVFTFEPGQDCYHTINVAGSVIQGHWVEMQTLYLVRGGDWRAVTEPARQLRGDQWTDDFGEHQAKLAERFAQG